MGRRSLKETVEKKKEFIQHYEKCLGLVTVASRYAGIDRDVVYRWRKSDLEFKEKMDGISEYVFDYVESKLFKLIEEGNVSAIIFYAKCKMKARGYIEKLEVSNEHSINFTFRDRIIDQT